MGLDVVVVVMMIVVVVVVVMGNFDPLGLGWHFE